MTENKSKAEEDPYLNIKYNVLQTFLSEIATDDPNTVIAMLDAIEKYCQRVSTSIKNEIYAHVWDSIKQHIAEIRDLFSDTLDDTTDPEPETEPS